MNILVFNCGSSSQSFRVYREPGVAEPVVIASGKARNVATITRAEPFIEWNIGRKTGAKNTALSSHRKAAEEILGILSKNRVAVDAIGHRFVHGGERFQKTVRIDAKTILDLQACFPLAPIHNPNAYSVIETCTELLPGVPQYAVFDTAFHAHLPEEAKWYAIPRELAVKWGFRKFGFHGLSYQYVSARAARLLGKSLEELKLILCHLGTGGSSVTAVKAGNTLDTSMGYSPLTGLVMSTRCGDIDAEIVLELIRKGYTPDEVDRILNNQSGLIGLSGFSSNLAEVIEESEKGNEDCRVAFGVYANRLKHYLGAFTWLLGGADAIVFTDDIGLKSWKLRQEVCSGVENLGIWLDLEVNRNAPANRDTRISRDESRTQIWIVPTDEEWVICQEVIACMSGS